MSAFFRKKGNAPAEVLAKSAEDTEDSKIKIGMGQALDESIRNSITEANVKYTRPAYNPETRKAYYDDGKAHKAAIDRAFSDGKTVKDPYSGSKLFQKQNNAT